MSKADTKHRDKHKDDKRIGERAKAAVQDLKPGQAALGAAVIGAGLALGAFLLRKRGGDTGGHALGATDQGSVEQGGASQGLTASAPEGTSDLLGSTAMSPVADAAGATSGAALEDDDAKLHALGTPTTLPVDGDIQNYTGEHKPDMAVDYVPGSDQDTGSAPAGATR